MKCKECRWWQQFKNNQNRGLCRKNPPFFEGMAGRAIFENRLKGVWPETDSVDWCGEFAPKK